MDHDRLLQQAIQQARSGNREQARDYLLEIVEANPNNVIAWVWLIDLLDFVDDRLYACEQVLAADPENAQLQAKYRSLQALRNTTLPEPGPPPAPVKPAPSNAAIVPVPDPLPAIVPAPKPAGVAAPKPAGASVSAIVPAPASPPADALAQAEKYLAKGQREEARNLLIPFVKNEKRNERAWLLLSEALDDEAKQIAALTNALRLNPANSEAQQRLKTLKHFRNNPLELAALYEEEGKFDEAIAVLHRATLNVSYGREFDRIYENIERLEKRKASGVVHIRPNYSIARLSFGPSLLFFFLMLVHNRMNPFAFTPLLWLGVLLTLGGGFLLALANVGARHPLWDRLFDDPGANNSPLARLTVSLAGWLLIVISFAYLFQISFERMPLVATNNFLVP